MHFQRAFIDREDMITFYFMNLFSIRDFYLTLKKAIGVVIQLHFIKILKD